MNDLSSTFPVADTAHSNPPTGPIQDAPQAPPIPPTSSAPPAAGSAGFNKEVEGIGLSSAEVPTLHEIGRDIDLPTEVAASGLTVQPTTVTVPPSVATLGVKATDDTDMGAAVQPVAFPISDDQIAQGLNQGITSSWRWLAAWCVRKLKQLHIIIKSVGGKVVREKN